MRQTRRPVLLMDVRRAVGAYFALQGTGVALWRLLLWIYPASRGYFRMGGSEATLLAFWLPDLVLLTAASLLGSYFCLANNIHAPAALYFVCGASCYATLFYTASPLRY